jgi:hypothetical protein
MTKVSLGVAAAFVGLCALGGCSYDGSGLPAVAGVDDDGGLGSKDGGKVDVPAAGGRGGAGGSAGAGGTGSGGQIGGGGNLGGVGSTGGSGGQGDGGTGAAGQGGQAGAPPDASVSDVPGTLGQGALCKFGNECGSGACIDGVCCENACAGTCMACTADKTGQLDGQCRTMKSGSDPDNECDAEAGNPCGKTGRCGIGACELAAQGVACGDRSCTGHTLIAAATCSGAGQCIIPAATACPGALKCASATACATDCSTDNDCTGNWLCDKTDGKCKPGLGLGVACDGNSTDVTKQCMSGHCVDGVCCETACGGTCMACAFAKTGARNGQCAGITAGSDPDTECTDQGAASCGNSGVCNGNGACRKYPDGTACGTGCCDTNSGQGHGARPCTYVCRAGRCDMAAPVVGAACGGNECCCTGSNGQAVPMCNAALSCALTGGTCN